MIINTGLGLLIHTNALIKGLEEHGECIRRRIGCLRGRGRLFLRGCKSDQIIDDDVLARMLSFNNVIVTSHQAFFTKEALR